MKLLPLLRFKTAILFFITLLAMPVSRAQKFSHIDFGKDTISSANANNAQRNFANSLNGTGKKASSSINLPVDKLKDIMDACSANSIAMVKVMIVSIRPEDVTHYSNHNPNLSSADKNEIVGRQILVFRVPRRAFEGAAGSKSGISNNNPLMLSLMSAGLILIDHNLAGLPPGSDDVYFSFGAICPPPASCD